MLSWFCFVYNHARFINDWAAAKRHSATTTSPSTWTHRKPRCSRSLLLEFDIIFLILQLNFILSSAARFNCHRLTWILFEFYCSCDQASTAANQSELILPYLPSSMHHLSTILSQYKLIHFKFVYKFMFQCFDVNVE